MGMGVSKGTKERKARACPQGDGGWGEADPSTRNEGNRDARPEVPHPKDREAVGRFATKTGFELGFEGWLRSGGSKRAKRNRDRAGLESKCRAEQNCCAQ